MDSITFQKLRDIETRFDEIETRMSSLTRKVIAGARAGQMPLDLDGGR